MCRMREFFLTNHWHVFFSPPHTAAAQHIVSSPVKFMFFPSTDLYQDYLSQKPPFYNRTIYLPPKKKNFSFVLATKIKSHLVLFFMVFNSTELRARVQKSKIGAKKKFGVYNNKKAHFQPECARPRSLCEPGTLCAKITTPLLSGGGGWVRQCGYSYTRSTCILCANNAKSAYNSNFNMI